MKLICDECEELCFYRDFLAAELPSDAGALSETMRKKRRPTCGQRSIVEDVIGLGEIAYKSALIFGDHDRQR